MKTQLNETNELLKEIKELEKFLSKVYRKVIIYKKKYPELFGNKS